MDDNKMLPESLEELLPEWTQHYLNERQRKELLYNIVYATYFAHGTEGHNVRMLVNNMSNIIGVLFSRNVYLEKQLESFTQKVYYPIQEDNKQ